MRLFQKAAFGFLLAPVLCVCARATDHFVSPAGGNNPPFLSWLDAATNIQDAIDASVVGDTVWVTNGIYASGSKVIGGGTVGRIGLNKALTVQSVNGPFATIVEGDYPSSLRCAWLTNGAVLRGFTLRNGGSGSSSGGGVYCYSTAATIANCLILHNTSGSSGGGVYQGTILNSALIGNTNANGGGASGSKLVNCTIAGNTGGGLSSVFATNCIICYNATPSQLLGTFSYCCFTNVVSGTGNIAANPQLLNDYIHIANASPCRGAGTNLASGTDIDGQPWANPPSIGCDEWQPAPIVAAPILALTNSPVGFVLSSGATGQDPLVYQWVHNGVFLQDGGHFGSTHTATLTDSAISLEDAGTYQLIVSNSLGMATSAPVQVIIRCVDAGGLAPAPPYLDWASAATNIQDAIDAALPGEIVLVTNGVYNSGGRVVAGGLTNRVVLSKALLVQSANGAGVTTIQGAWDIATNGPAAVRCVWLTNNTILSGFTLCHGATLAYKDSGDAQEWGGGVFASSAADSCVANCLIISNSAGNFAGGAYSALLLNCTLAGNILKPAAFINAGGAGNCNLRNCVISGNSAYGGSGGGLYGGSANYCAIVGNLAGSGGGAYSVQMTNCTLSGNVSSGSGGGASASRLVNCIAFGNQPGPSYGLYSNYNANSQLSYSCATPLASGAGNIVTNPLLLADGIHISAASPCRGAGIATAVSGADIDGQAWANPPSMGCDEWLPAPLIFTQPVLQLTTTPFGFRIGLDAIGQEPLTCFWTHNGTLLTNDNHFLGAGTSVLVAMALLPTDAGSYQVVVSNALGAVTSSVVQLQLPTFHFVDAAGSNPTPPYLDWNTAATNIQDAIDAALPGEIVLVTNGVYASGGAVMAGDLNNRIAITSAMTVESANGPAVTTIQGWNGLPGPGPGISGVRCAWLTNGATLEGFTLANGGTRTNGDQLALQSGAGVWAPSLDANVINCILTNNQANYAGGGSYLASLKQCFVFQNRSINGGGAYQSSLEGCLVTGNNATTGSGVYGGGLTNCTMIANIISGVYGSAVRNCIFYYEGYTGSGFNISYSCSYPQSFPPGGTSNTNVYPQFIDAYHVAATSPCRGAGSGAYSSGADIDGEVWANPPSMGCDEVLSADLIGPLIPHITPSWTNAAIGKSFTVSSSITGHASRIAWDFGDGTVSNATSFYNPNHAWTNLGNYTVTLTAYNNDYPDGVPATVVVPVVPIAQPPFVTIDPPQFGSVTMRIVSQPGVSYTVQITTNLTPPVAWQNGLTLTGLGGLWSVVDFSANTSNRFYRVWAH